MTFIHMFVHNVLSSVLVAEWPCFGKELSTWFAVFSPCIWSICNLSYFPFWF